MNEPDTLLLNRTEISQLLSLEECMAAVELAFRQYASGEAHPPGVLGLHVAGGGFHLKAGVMSLPEPYFVAKINANFPANPQKFALSTIQGVLALFNAENGKLLALMDSMEITVLRTGAATGVATKYLSREASKTALICGCGIQGRISFRVLRQVRNLEKIYVFDIEEEKARQFAWKMEMEYKTEVQAVNNLSKIVPLCDICVTCTTSTQAFLMSAYVSPGTFIAAVGADSEFKQELESALFTRAKLIVDVLEQCANIGELHHALKTGILKKEGVYTGLGEVLTGQKKGRSSEEEIIVFDSTGMALQDVVAAVKVYEKATQKGIGTKWNLSQ